MGLQSSVYSILSATDPERSYWSVEMSSGKHLSERSFVFDFRAGGIRLFDWSLDLVSTGDIEKIKILTLHCPDGQQAILQIEEPGTAFQLKIASKMVLSAGHVVQAHLIGKVINKESGACICFIWDRDKGLLQHTSTVYAFSSWRSGILPLGKLSCDVLGLRLS